MRILAIGDFHGKFPEKLRKEAKKADVILSTGDFTNSDKIRKIIFKYWTNKSWIEVVGKKKAKLLEKESFYSGLKVLKELNSLGKRTFIVFGNTDFYKSERSQLFPEYYEKNIKHLKNLILIDKRKSKLKGIEVIGHGGYVDSTEYIKHPIDKDKKKQKLRLVRYKEYEKNLFKLFSGKPKNFIFLTHYTPYGYFDKISSKKGPMYGKHVGFEPYNKVIKKYNPLLCICGHMHEYQGMKRLGKTIVINPGPAYEGKAALIDVERQKIKSIKFLR
jgi:Icc-related predicted phosphoesterase